MLDKGTGRKIFFVPQLSFTHENFTIYALSEIPLYQYLNGTQVGSQHQFTAGISYRFNAYKSKIKKNRKHWKNQKKNQKTWTSEQEGFLKTKNKLLIDVVTSEQTVHKVKQENKFKLTNIKSYDKDLVIKVFAILNIINFSWFLLPPLIEKGNKLKRKCFVC